jgi:hypothetical protein
MALTGSRLVANRLANRQTRPQGQIKIAGMNSSVLVCTLGRPTGWA